MQLIDGYFKDYHAMPLPATPGHEIAGSIEQIGDLVPESAQLSFADQVVVVGGWGDGACRHCQIGDTQICAHGKWPGFSAYGGYGEFVPVPYKYLIRVDKRYGLKPGQLAPLTDAGLTPYRGVKKLRHAGVLGPDRVVAVFGVGGLGAYAVQYAKLLSSGATVVAFARNDDKLAIAKEHGADHAINIKGKSTLDIRSELARATGRPEIDAAIDCAGNECASISAVPDESAYSIFQMRGQANTAGGSWRIFHIQPTPRHSNSERIPPAEAGGLFISTLQGRPERAANPASGSWRIVHIQPKGSQDMRQDMNDPSASVGGICSISHLKLGV